MKRFVIPAMAACFAALLVSSCEKNNPQPTPDYVGTWDYSYRTLDGEDTLDVRDVLTLEADTYEEIIQYRNETYMTSLKSFAGIRGGLSVDGYTMKVSVNQLGISSADDNMMPTGSLMWYSKGSQEYYQLVSSLGVAESFSSDYSIAGDVMTMLVDLNHDGDFQDPGEVSIYDRQ
jgi:hypothetical protein